MKGRTKDLLAGATASNVEQVLKYARKKGWRDDSIRRHGNEIVAAALDGTLPPRKPARVRQVAQQAYAAPRTTAATVKPVSEQVLRVNVTRDGQTAVGIMEISKARKKQAPSVGLTHDCGIGFQPKPRWLKKAAYLFTLSVLAAKRVAGGERVHVWLDGHGCVVTLHDDQQVH